MGRGYRRVWLSLRSSSTGGTTPGGTGAGAVVAPVRVPGDLGPVPGREHPPSAAPHVGRPEADPAGESSRPRPVPYAVPPAAPTPRRGPRPGCGHRPSARPASRRVTSRDPAAPVVVDEEVE